jgi:hypothetical protein
MGGSRLRRSTPGGRGFVLDVPGQFSRVAFVQRRVRQDGHARVNSGSRFLPNRWLRITMIKSNGSRVGHATSLPVQGRRFRDFFPKAAELFSLVDVVTGASGADSSRWSHRGSFLPSPCSPLAFVSASFFYGFPVDDLDSERGSRPIGLDPRDVSSPHSYMRRHSPDEL